MAARTVDEARQKAAYQLGVDASEVELRVAGARRGGLLGLGAPDIIVEAWRAAQNERGGTPNTQADVAASAPIAALPPAPTEVPRIVEAPPSPTRPKWLVWSEAGDCMFRTSGRGAILSEVEDAVVDWPFDEYFGDGLRAAIVQANDANVMIGRIAPPPEMTADTTFFLKIPTDAMSAWAIPGHQPFDRVMNAAELLAALA
ncbi:MAG: Jag N-terminal domain-containing protein, partial [Chloroflexota bacterium]